MGETPPEEFSPAKGVSEIVTELLIKGELLIVPIEETHIVLH